MDRTLVRVVLAVVCLTSVVAPVVAQGTPAEDEAPYYDDENGTTNMTDWIPNDGEASAEAILELLSRTPGIWLGTGDMDPSGSGYEGVLLLALVVGAATLMGAVGTGIGPVGGSMIGMVLAFGMTTIGLIPIWIQPILLFTLAGVPASIAIIRVFR